MKIATFNANSIRARLAIVQDWLGRHQPDVLAVQETKVTDADFPAESLRDLGYEIAFHGQKSYNGVVLLSRKPLQEVRFGFQDGLWPDDCRIVSAEVDGVAIVNTYVPNGTAVGTDKFDYKLRWLERFGKLVGERYSPGDPVIWLGDINIAPTEDDVFEPERQRGKVGFHADEVAALEKLVDWGWADTFRIFTQGPGHYTFWEFYIPKAFEKNLGWRIDHIYATEPLADKCLSCEVDKEPRALEKPSDHTFVVAEFA
jgi:exodeoxyribonuclease III